VNPQWNSAEKFGDVVFRLRYQPTLALEYVSEGAEDLTGMTQAELMLGPSAWRRLLMPADLAELIDDPSAFFAAPRIIRINPTDSTTRWLHLTVSADPADSHDGVIVGRILDVTKETEERDLITAEVNLTSMLEPLARAELDGIDLGVLMRRAGELAVDGTNADGAIVFEIDEVEDLLLVRAQTGCGRTFASHPAIDIDDGIRALLGGDSAMDVKLDDLPAGPLRLMLDEELTGVALVCPVSGPASSSVGMTVAFRRDQHRFGAHDVRFMAQLSRLVAVGIIRSRHEQEIMRMSLTDSITELPNKKSLAMSLRRRVGGGSQLDSAHLVAVVDLDNFHRVNDLFGHEVGDTVLRSLGYRFRKTLPDDALIARLTGDRFAAAVEWSGSEPVVDSVVRAVRSALTESMEVDGHEIVLTACIGLALCSRESEAKEAISNASVAVQNAKSQGRDVVEIFDDAMRRDVAAKLLAESELRQAIERDEFVLHYQPVVDTATEMVVGAEALVRWQHPVRGLIPPGDFIPLAEETGLIVPLGARVLEEALRCAQRWADVEGCESRRWMSINVSAIQLRDPGLVDIVRGALERSGVDPSRIHLEMTETAMFHNSDDAGDRLRRLADLGVGLAVDDFGTGWSSLGQMRKFPQIDVLKIDRSFVSGLPGQAGDRHVVEAIVALGKAFGATATVAEGVETAEQLQCLREIGCPFAQGYFWSKPVPPDQFIQWCRTDGGL